MSMVSTERRRLGRTDLYVSRLGLGAAPLGNRQNVTDAQAIATVHAALEHGVRFVDTAPLYGAGTSERRLGLALAGVPRDSYVLSTKVGRLVTDDGSVVFDWSADGIRRSVEASLTRLKLDRVDILLMHDPDNHYEAALHDAYPVLDDLRRQGMIGAVGAGMNQWQLEADFARDANMDCFLLAGQYTLIEQTPLDTFLPMIAERGIGLYLGGVYNSGILAVGARTGATYNYRPAPDAIRERVARIEGVCTRHGVPLRAAALQFAAAHPAVTAPLFGAASPEEVREAIEGFQFPIPADLWDDLRAEGLIPAHAPVPA